MGNKFESKRSVLASSFVSSSGSWTSFEIYPRFAADVDGDGKADAVGFGHAGVSAATSNLEFSYDKVVLTDVEYDWNAMDTEVIAVVGIAKQRAINHGKQTN